MKMEKITRLTIVLLVLFGLQISCSTAQTKKETRKVADFDKIGLAISADMYITQGSKNELIIEADEDVLEKIETEVNGTSLSIKFEKWYNYKGMGKINIYVTVKDIKRLDVAGSGDIIAKSAIKTEKLAFVVSGSGSIIIEDLSVSVLDAMVTGSGDIKINGSSVANELEVTITGSGDFESTNIEFKKAELTITGSGSIKTHVSDQLEADITGSGRIYYSGKPIIDADITGSGKIRNIN